MLKSYRHLKGSSTYAPGISAKGLSKMLLAMFAWEVLNPVVLAFILVFIYQIDDMQGGEKLAAVLRAMLPNGRI